VAEHLQLKEVFDGVTWTKGEVQAGQRGFLSCWVGGLPENADRANVRAFLGNRRLEVDYVGERNPDGFRQVNAVVPANVVPGEYEFCLECAGVRTEVRVRVV
jgi:uncharacterized protein (TIGR03437 family)